MNTKLKLTADQLVMAMDAMQRGDNVAAYGLLIEAIRMPQSDMRRAACTKAFCEVCRTLQISPIHAVV